jgi:hypothetical protein
MRSTGWVVGSFALACLLSSCGVLRVGRSFDLGEQLIEGSPAELDGEGAPIPMPLTFDVIAETPARTAAPATHVYLASFTLSVTSTSEPSGDTDDLSFVDEIEVFLESAEEGSTLPRIRIAHLDPIPDGERTISLEVTDEDLLPYLQGGLRLEAIAMGQQPTDDVSYTGHFECVVIL